MLHLRSQQIYAALHHAVACGLFAVPPLGVQMPFMLTSGRSIQVLGKKREQKSAAETVA
jgi:hypothetical protein